MLVGAALGAALRPAPTALFRAEVAIGVDTASASSAADRGTARGVLVSSAQLPAVLRDTAAAVGTPDAAEGLGDRVSVVGDPMSPIIRLQVTAETQPAANRLASVLAARAIAAAQRAMATPNGPRTAVGFGFEQDLGGWGATPSIFNLAPRSLTRTRAAAFAGRFSLATDCPQRNGGCGPSVSIAGPFRIGRPQVATARVRTLTPAPATLRLVFGASPQDVKVSLTVRVGSRWRTVSVRWTPAHATSEAEVGVQTVGGPARFAVDDVVVAEGTNVRDPTRSSASAADATGAAGRAAAARYVHVEDPVATPRAPLMTARSAAFGGGLGLLAAVGGLGAAQLARRKRDGEHEPDSDL